MTRCLALSSIYFEHRICLSASLLVGPATLHPLSLSELTPPVKHSSSSFLHINAQKEVCLHATWCVQWWHLEINWCPQLTLTFGVVLKWTGVIYEGRMGGEPLLLVTVAREMLGSMRIISIYSILWVIYVTVP